MPDLPEKIADAADAIRKQCGLKPQLGIILGTGLGKLVDKLDIEAKIPYHTLPHFVESTVEFHQGELILGKLNGKPVVAMHGRFHFYEGYSMEEVTFPVRVMKALGITDLVVSNACGGTNPQFRPSDIMVITDHINLLGQNPLIGKNHNGLGPRFPDMSEPYSREYIERIQKIALDMKIPLQKGVFACMSGPSLETAAEYRMLRIIGADAIGMSTVPEVIVAVHSGLKVLGLSIITDECLPDALKPINIQEIIANAGRAEEKLVPLITAFANSLAKTF